MKRLRGGFTLIEMLVVLAIVALLAAVLFPVFSPVREKGRHGGSANFLLADGYVQWTAASGVSAGGTAATPTNEQSRSGCQYAGRGAGSFPCAEGTGSGKHALIFSAQ